MIVVDTSAIVAIIKREVGFEAIRSIALSSPNVLMSVGNLLELHLVTTDYRAFADVPAMLRQLRVSLQSVSEVHLAAAVAAHDRFGRGSGHPARLNFGDCFAYALAKTLGAPLLFKGKDFAQTDIEAVPY